MADENTPNRGGRDYGFALLSLGLFALAGLVYRFAPQGTPYSVMFALLVFAGFAVLFRGLLKLRK